MSQSVLLQCMCWEFSVLLQCIWVGGGGEEMGHSVLLQCIWVSVLGVGVRDGSQCVVTMHMLGEVAFLPLPPFNEMLVSFDYKIIVLYACPVGRWRIAQG